MEPMVKTSPLLGGISDWQVIWIYPALVLFEQSNCIYWIICCYIRSLTNTWFMLSKGQKQAQTWTSQSTPWKTMRTTLVFVFCRIFSSCFVLFDIAENKHNIRTLSEDMKFIHLHPLRDRLEKLAKGSIFYLFLKLLQINFTVAAYFLILSIY